MKWIDELYLLIIVLLSAYVVYHTKGDATVAVSVLGLNATAIAFMKWRNGKDN